MNRRFPLRNPNRFPFNPRRQAFNARILAGFELFDAGQFLQSAQLFEELAGIAEARNGPRAPRFYIQAGRGYLHGGKIMEGMAMLEKGHQLFIDSGRPEAAGRLGLWLPNELNQLGLSEQAKLVARWAGGMTTVASKGAQQPPLPLKCPSCGGPVLPNEVTWLDVVTAECEYCGSPLRGSPGQD